MSKKQNQEEFYANLKEQLAETSNWPSEYLYKFIVKTSPEKIIEVESIFDNAGAVITTKESSNAKYTSISVNIVMENPDAVIAKYLEVTQKVEDVISL